MAGAVCRVESGQVGSAPKGRKIPPPRFQPDLPNGQENEAREHDGDERRSVVPEHHPAVEVGGVVVHEIEQGILAKHGEGTADKAPQGVPQPAEKQKDVRNEAPPFHSSVSLPSAPPFGAAPSLPAGINEDDSDPAWGRIEAWNSAPLSGPHDPPGFRGVAIVLPDFPGSARVRPISRGETQRNERHKGMWLCRTFSQNRATPSL